MNKVVQFAKYMSLIRDGLNVTHTDDSHHWYDHLLNLIQSEYCKLYDENIELKRGYEIDEHFAKHSEFIKQFEDDCTYCGKPTSAIKSVAWQHVVIGGLYEYDEDESMWMKTTTYIDGHVDHEFFEKGPNGESL